MATTAEILRTSAGMFGRVLPVASGFACELCLGPVTDYSRCSSCHRLVSQGLPHELLTRVVPMTSALNPSKWYTWLQTYKTYHPERGDVIASLSHEYMRAHRRPIEAILGGPVSMLTLVPSKKPGFTFSTQPLRKALSRVASLATLLKEVLHHVPGAQIGRSEYRSDAFRRTGISVVRERIVIIEDTWVTGATALSAAGALYAFGVANVLVLPIARLINSSYWSTDHPYREGMVDGTYDPLASTSWPR